MEEQFELETMKKVKDLEQSYVDDLVNNLDKYVEEEKEKICTKLKEYSVKNKQDVFDRNGYKIDSLVLVKPTVINNYFFKSIVEINSIIPEYTADKLGLVYNYYCYVVSEINENIGNYPPSLVSFCKLAGLTQYTLSSLRNSSDISLRNVTNKIYDEIGDGNISMAQLGMVKEKSTQFKLRTQNEMVEKVTPNVNINITETVDKDVILSKIDKYSNLIKKKGNE